MVKSKLPPRSGSSLEAVELHPKKRGQKFYFFKCNTVCSKPYKHLFFKTLFTSVVIVSYQSLCFLSKEVGLVLVSRNSTTITFTPSLTIA